jgi:hypothetical protein
MSRQKTHPASSRETDKVMAGHWWSLLVQSKKCEPGYKIELMANSTCCLPSASHGSLLALVCRQLLSMGCS